MKKIIVLVLCLMPCPTKPGVFEWLGLTQQIATRPKTETQEQTVEIPITGSIDHFHLHNHIHNTNINSPTNNNEVNTSQATSVNNNVEVNAIASAVSNACAQAWNTYPEHLQNFWQDNKWSIGAAGVASVYSYYCYQVICGNFYLQRTDLWSAWKENLSFDELCSIPQQTLSHDLLLTIQHQGLDMHRPTDFTIPLIVFLLAIEKERTTLLYYQTLHKRITMVKCGRLFPFNTQRYEGIEARLQRLSFVKNIFISWMAEFNVAHAKSLMSYSPPPPAFGLRPM